MKERIEVLKEKIMGDWNTPEHDKHICMDADGNTGDYRPSRRDDGSVFLSDWYGWAGNTVRWDDLTEEELTDLEREMGMDEMSVPPAYIGPVFDPCCDACYMGDCDGHMVPNPDVWG